MSSRNKSSLSHGRPSGSTGVVTPSHFFSKLKVLCNDIGDVTLWRRLMDVVSICRDLNLANTRVNEVREGRRGEVKGKIKEGNGRGK